MAIVEDVASNVASLPRVSERTAATPRAVRSPWTIARLALTDARALAGAIAAMAPLVLRRRPIGREAASPAGARDGATRTG
jgi:hypothetical protein